MAWPIVTLDLDGTLVRTTVFDAIARHVGGSTLAALEAYDDHFFAGRMSLEACFMAEYDLFYDLPVSVVGEALDAAPWARGIAGAVADLKAAGSTVLVLTDQPSWAVEYVLARFDIDDAVCTHARVRDGRIGGVEAYNFDKLAGLSAHLRRAGARLGDVAHVGNGANDVPVFRAVGRGIAFQPSSDEVSRAADAAVTTWDLGDVLPHLTRVE